MKQCFLPIKKTMCSWEEIELNTTLLKLSKKSAYCHWEVLGSLGGPQRSLQELWAKCPRLGYEEGSVRFHRASVLLNSSGDNLTSKYPFSSVADLIQAAWIEVLPHSCHAANQLWTKGRKIGIRKSPCEQGVLHCSLRKENFDVKCPEPGRAHALLG